MTIILSGIGGVLLIWAVMAKVARHQKRLRIEQDLAEYLRKAASE